MGRIARTALSAALALAMTPAGAIGAFAEEAQGQQAQTTIGEAEIQEMLQAGEYVEGEAVAVVTTDLATRLEQGTFRWPWESASQGEELLEGAETLMSASAKAVRKSGDADLAGADVSGKDAVRIVLVEGEGLSTSQVMEQLSGVEGVLSVEPNYVSQAEDTQSIGLDSSLAQDQEDSASASLEAETQEEDPDLTSTQWAFSNSADNTAFSHEGSKRAAGFDIGADAYGWNDADSENSAGVVAVMDSGIDYTNPDLDDVVMNNADAYNAAGGPHGFNAAATEEDDADPKDSMDVNGHGTHCSGIIAAEWNGQGTSGACNGVQLLGVRVAGSDGTISTASVLRGFDYLSTAMDNGLELVAVNMSFGNDVVMSPIQSVAIAELGKKGAISILSSGNSNLDNDISPSEHVSYLRNPYAVVVDAATLDGEKASYSSYGQLSTNVYGPGSEIISTYSLNGKKSYLGIADPSPLYLNTFSGDLGDMRVSGRSDSAVPESQQEIADSEAASYSSDVTMDSDSGSLCLDSSSIVGNGDAGSVLVYAPVDADQVSSIQRIGFTIYAPQSDTSAAVSTFWTLSDGSVKESDAVYAMLNDLWSQFAINTKSNAPAEGATLYTVATDDADTVLVPLCITFKNVVKGNVYIDDFAFGTHGTNHGLLSGTSMAAPAVTGTAGIVAKIQKDKGQSLSGSESALWRAAYIQSHIYTMKDYEDTCSQQGMVDLSTKSTKLTPVITSATNKGTVLTIKGSYFTDARGETDVAGRGSAVINWGDKLIDTVMTSLPNTGYYPLLLTSVTGKTCTYPIYVNGNTAVETFESLSSPNTSELSAKYYTGYVSGALSSSGSLVAAGGKVYAVLAGFSRSGEVFDLLCYDVATDKWTKIESLPLNISSCSMVEDNGKLLMACTMNSVDEKSPSTLNIYTYDITTSSFVTVDTSEINADGKGSFAGSALVKAGDKLLLVGGYQNDAFTTEDNIAQLTVEGGKASVKTVGSLCISSDGKDYGIVGARAAVFNGDVYVTGGSFGSEKAGAPYGGLLKLSCASDGTWTCTDISSLLPEGIVSNSASSLPSFGIASTSEGVVIVGADVAGSGGRSQQDSYILRDGASAFEPFDQSLSLGLTHNAIACSEGDKVYAMATSMYTDNGDNVVFGAGHSHVAGAVQDVTVKAATCTDGGIVRHVTACTVCGEELSSETAETAALGHDYQVSSAAVSATCTERGREAVETCTRCGATRGGTPIARIDHSAAQPVREDEVAATYAAKGSYAMVTRCSMCGTEMSRQAYEIPQLTLGKVAGVKAVQKGKRKAKVTWSKVAGATGYQVTYKCGSASKTVKAAGASKVVSKLTRGKKYTFAVRAYVAAGASTAYGAWSAAVKLTLA